ncbi:Aldo/keto reductase [Auriscalpium vulgare]|uniref:Aldo/keto reductase n=1 Tax=Auriscalpium vulgare TaxID=40419 RepID=A0ACB8RYX5_9AGAM|nr:Aldo/keto reductase [Auriscalpium vulgare]
MGSSKVLSRRVPYVRLGSSGLMVSKIILGCMSYGTPEWMPWVLNEEEGVKHIKAAYDTGIQTFDTANIYSMGLSEIVLGKAIKQHHFPRDEIVVMTKVHGLVARTVTERYRDKSPEDFGYVNQEGLSRKHIFDSVQDSLQRLQLDYINVLQCHRFDPNTPIEETMQALHDVVQKGWARYIGMSSCFAWQFHVMQNYAIAHNLTPFISMQNHYNLLYREEEREMMPSLKHFGVASIPWSPLGRGLLARPPDQEKTKRGAFDRWHAMYLENSGGEKIIHRVAKLAKEKGVTMGQLSLAWIMAKDAVAAPVVGTTSLDNLYDLLGAFDVEINEEEIKFLEEPYTPMPILGHP